jgi:hypothetical protein
MRIDRTIFKINPKVKIQLMESGAILLNTLTGDCFELNTVGAEIWNRLLQGDSNRSIVDSIAHGYNVAPPIVEVDLKDLLTTLSKHGLLLSVAI